MFNINKKLTNLSREDQEELRRRADLISQYRLVAQALELQKTLWLNGCLKRLGLDLNKDYNVNLKDGAVTEIKKETIDEPTGDKKNP